MNSLVLSLLVLLSSVSARAAVSMAYELKTYAVVKPTNISTSISIGSGLVQKMQVELGQTVKVGSGLIEILEENTLRAYRSPLAGQVVKLHVTQGAAVSPGMPLVTVMDTAGKYLEMTLSPEEAKLISVGAKIQDVKTHADLGSVDFVSALVDPDHGGVVAHAKKVKLSHRVGEVIHVILSVANLQCSKIIATDEVREKEKYNIKVIHQKKICLE